MEIIRNIKMHVSKFSRFGYAVFVLICFAWLSSCQDWVDDGLETNYGESLASLEVNTITLPYGAPGDTIIISVSAESDVNIKSLVVKTKTEGAGGSGFDVSTGAYDDPFADHIWGTLKKDVKSFNVKYNYIIPGGINKSNIIFSIVDEIGIVSDTVRLSVVPSIARYAGIELVAKDHIFFDAFATLDGQVYENIKTNYSSFNATSLSAQENIDIVFYFKNNVSGIGAPSDDNLGIELEVENSTLFKKLENFDANKFNNISPALLVDQLQNDSIAYKGFARIANIKVGDYIGFSTDILALHSRKQGIIKIKELHPTQVDRFNGISYLLECDIVTQIDE